MSTFMERRKEHMKGIGDAKRAMMGIPQHEEGEGSLLERIAAVEHEHWIRLAGKLLAEEEFTPSRAERWHRFRQTPYERLPDPMKEMYRARAKDIIEVIQNFMTS